MAIILTDSTCDIGISELNALHVEMLSVKVSFGTDEYADKRGITNEEFYNRLEQCDELPTTTLINIGEFIEAYDRFKHDDIVVITLSSKLSGTYQSAVAACSMSHRDNIFVVDSATVSGGLALLVKQAVKLRDEGFGAREIADKIELLKGRVRTIAMIDTLKYLVKGGRLSGVSGAVGSVLGIKPICSIENGVVNNIAKARSVGCAINEIVRIVTMDKPIDRLLPHIYVHTNNDNAMNQLIDKLDSADGASFDRYMIGSVVGTHAGPGAVAVCYFEKD
ncbi:MAG: DegV family protein [Oscillospiraceae bacterium]